jgi:hypothetical protein
VLWSRRLLGVAWCKSQEADKVANPQEQIFQAVCHSQQAREYHSEKQWFRQGVKKMMMMMMMLSLK